jgi:hypothetical protein
MSRQSDLLQQQTRDLLKNGPPDISTMDTINEFISNQA